MVPVVHRAALAAPDRRALEAEIRPLATLADVLRWAFGGEPRRDVAEVVVQDEFTHDVVIPWRNEVHLVFDST